MTPYEYYRQREELKKEEEELEREIARKKAILSQRRMWLLNNKPIECMPNVDD